MAKSAKLPARGYGDGLLLGTIAQRMVWDRKPDGSIKGKSQAWVKAVTAVADDYAIDRKRVKAVLDGESRLTPAEEKTLIRRLGRWERARVASVFNAAEVLAKRSDKKARESILDLHQKGKAKKFHDAMQRKYKQYRAAQDEDYDSGLRFDSDLIYTV